jgi:hypothetical protein
MRLRAALLTGTAVALTTVLPGPAQAAPTLPLASAAAPARSPDPLAAARTLTLVTGQRVHLVGASGHERVVVDAEQRQAAGDALVVRRLGPHLYVYPVAIEPLLGRSVDLALFDLHAVRTGTDGRTPVRVSYTGSRPSIPGLHVSAAENGVAQGYVTTRSSAAFGAALRDQATAGGGADAPLAGVATIGPARSAAPTTSRRFPMKTLVIKVVRADGKPQPDGLVTVLSVDDGEKYGADVPVTRGEARISVPTGTYSAISDDFIQGKTEDTGRMSIVTVNEYVVKGAGQTMTIDHRSATVTPTVGTPRPADPTGFYLEWDRGDVTQDYTYGAGYFVPPGIQLKVAPSAPARVGTVDVVQSWSLAQRAARPAYAYSLARLDDHVPAGSHTFRTEDLATVESTYDGDGSGARGGTARIPLFEDTGAGGSIDPVVRGTSRTEYAGAVGGAVQWADTTLLNEESAEDPGFFDRDPRPLAPRSTTRQEWFRGPLGAGITVQGSDGFCYGCRSGNTISLGLAPVTDSDPLHYGDLSAAGDGLPVARFRLYRGDRLVHDEDDTTGADVKVSAKKRTYRAVLDVDRREVDPRLSTRSRTEMTFSSARGKGARLPRDWYCDDDECRVLPLLQARASLATDHQGQLPLARTDVTVQAAQVQNATTSPVTAASLEYRPTGGEWTRVELRRTSEGVYKGVIDVRDDPGTLADLRVSASDKAGSTYTQTVSRAFSVATK